MNARLTHSMPDPGASSQRAFTLLEMLVSVTVMVFIIFGLYAMFAQTQKAFRGVAGEVDVLEGGRAAIELISRDIAQMSASGVVGYENFGVFGNGVIRTPVIQIYPDGAGNTVQTNILRDFYLLTRNGRNWEGHGYYVHRSPSGTGLHASTNGFGALYRFQTNNTVLTTNIPLIAGFYSATPLQSNSYLIVDGIVHLTVAAFDARGDEITPLGNSLSGATIPHLVEIELGIMEPDIVGQARSLPNYAAFTNFLNQQAGKVHFFRQQVPIRSATR